MRLPGSEDSAISELQGSLVLLVAILIVALLIKSTIADGIVSAAFDFGRFKVWGAHNNVSYPNGTPAVTITSPPDGSRIFADLSTSISGNVYPASGRSTGFVYFRINGGSWTKASLANDTWSSAPIRHPPGSYHVEAIAYDGLGEESPMASSTFESVFRPYPDAAYIGDDIPSTMTAGEAYGLYIDYSNTGYLAWNDSKGYALSPYNTSMSLPSIGPGAQQVEPHGNHTFSLTFTAPGTPGTYRIGYRMRCPGFGWFGDELSKPVTVVEPAHDARVVSIDMPAEMNAGEAKDVSITMENTGTATWFAEGPGTAYLGMIDGTNGEAYKFNRSSDRIRMVPGSIVRNGSAYTFKFRITAPGAGRYYTQYRMVWDGHYAFGQIAGCTINVKAPKPGGKDPTPTPALVLQYNAHGKMILQYRDGSTYTGPIRYYYDGPLGNHFERSSRGASSDSSSRWDWDIGGPNGHYKIYNDVDGYSGGLQFDMNNGGNKGKVTFIK